MSASATAIRPSFLLVFVCTTQLLILSLSGAEPGKNWAQFRGPNATGVYQGKEEIPARFSSKEKVLWSAELGEGIASPVIWQGRVYATAFLPDTHFVCFCLDATSGEEIWRRQFDTGPLPKIMPPNTHASSTPATDGERVYVYFSTLGLMALDADTGASMWTYKTPLPVYLMGWGAAHSPILVQDMLVFNQDDDLSPFLMALDKVTGEVRWRTPRPEMLAGYAVPVVCTAEGQTDIVIAGSGKLKGYDPDSGIERWTCNSLLRTIMTTPAVHEDTLYVAVQSYGDSGRVLKYALLQWTDVNQDGKLSKAELDPSFEAKFDRGDQDQDGFLNEDEIDRAFQSPDNRVGGGKIIQAIRGGGKGDVTATHMKWNLQNNRAPSNIASPLVVDNRLFLVKRGGLSACLNAENGEALWMQKRIRNLGYYYASPVAGDGKIFVAGHNGYVVVLKQGSELDILAKNDMEEPCIATPAIAGGKLYIRTLNHLYCISAEAAKKEAQP